MEPIKREYIICLLYTSDAADERSSVDLGGRRIIKKKNSLTLGGSSLIRETTCTEETYKIIVITLG